MTAEIRPSEPEVREARQLREALEGRLARRLAAALAERAEAVPHDIGERLRVARRQALARGRLARHQAEAARAEEEVRLGGALGARGASAILGRRRQAHWQRLAASLLPLIVLLIGLAAVDRFAERERVLAAAEIDTQLLADDLPPAAYADPGFVEFLRSPPP
jgi:hypothetical protein